MPHILSDLVPNKLVRYRALKTSFLICQTAGGAVDRMTTQKRKLASCKSSSPFSFVVSTYRLPRFLVEGRTLTQYAQSSNQAVAQVCNDHQDCSDGTDEDSKLCGMIWIIVYFLLPFEILIFSISDCCELVSAQYTDNNTLVFQEHPYIFTTFKKESKIVNGRASYTSQNGKYSLETAKHGSWGIINSNG